MRSFNKVMLVGRIGSEPKASKTKDDIAYIKFSFATDKSYKNKTTEEYDTDWHNIIVWGKLAELCIPRILKGSSLFIEGEISYSLYKNESTGQSTKFTQITAREIIFLDKKISSSFDSINKVKESTDLPF